MKRTPLKRRTPVKKRNAKRRASEFTRCYHSVERVEFVKSLACVKCCERIFGLWKTLGRCDNAHTATDGAGRKAGYETIIPLCRSCHRKYDEHRKPFDTPETREHMRNYAIMTQQRWLAFVRDANQNAQ